MTGQSSYIENHSIQEEDGSTHLLGFINSTQQRSLDGTGFFVDFQANRTIIKNREGIATTWDQNGVTSAGPNGNQITASQGWQITDTMGRQIPPVSGNWIVPGPNGGTVTYTVSS